MACASIKLNTPGKFGRSVLFTEQTDNAGYKPLNVFAGGGRYTKLLLKEFTRKCIASTIVCKIYWEFTRFHWKSWLEVKD